MGPPASRLALLLLALLLAALAAPALANFEPKGEHSNFDPLGHKKEHTKEHIAENVTLKDEDDADLAFFKVTDLNNDGFLDGHELRTAFSDYDAPEDQRIPVQEVDDMVDHTLREDDRDGDGKISLEEYLASQEYHAKAD
ncbi:hypothetical protein DFJ74DRAFT_712479 [Hyaloraphidium curvatum]|nr:hypothetical protein DFJ74DRAFT_712479 [Hyaloraphidium curvatum]